MASVVTERFIECHAILKEKGTIRTNSEFADALECSPQSMSDTLNRRRDITIELLRKAVEKYNINPVYLTLGSGPRFLNEANPSGLQILSLVTDEHNNERIVHVPIAAQAGYAQEFFDPVFVKELPTYNIPDYEFSQGTFRSFDVEGNSMYPTLHRGDRVICQYVEPGSWTYSIKENQVYVIVIENGVIVKRVKNRLKQDGYLVICSDNERYESYNLEAQQLKEVWKVKFLLKRFDHFRGNLAESNNENIKDLKLFLHEQHQEVIDFLRELKKDKKNPFGIST